MVKAFLVGALFAFILSAAYAGGKKDKDGAGTELGPVIEGCEFFWGTYDDHESPNDGSSTIEMEEGEVDGMVAYTFTGQVTSQFQYGFVGVFINPINTDAAEALTTCSAFSFKIKGDGNRYSFKVGTTDVKDYCVYETVFGTKKDEVVEVVVRLKPKLELVQPTWGQYVKFVQENIDQLQFQTTNNGRPGTCEFTVWDFKLHS